MGQEGSRLDGGIPGGPVSAAALQAKGIRRMDPNVQRKLQNAGMGSVFNMKIVIRGDSATGKSALLRRLEGGGFIPEHYATPAIQVATINWNYKATDDIIKVDVWDVVDVGKQRPIATDPSSPHIGPSSHSRRSSTTAAADFKPMPDFPVTAAVDAASVDVYKGANAVIVMVDPTRKWTFDYAKQEIAKVPKGVDILLLVNFRDLSDRRVVSNKAIEQWLRTQEANVRSTECSLLNCYGLKQVYTFLNLPFLKMKYEALQKQVEQAKEDLVMAEKELDIVFTQDYDSYLMQVESRRSTAPPVTPAIVQDAQRSGSPGPGGDLKGQGGDSRRGSGVALPNPLPKGSPRTDQQVQGLPAPLKSSGSADSYGGGARSGSPSSQPALSPTGSTHAVQPSAAPASTGQSWFSKMFGKSAAPAAADKRSVASAAAGGKGPNALGGGMGGGAASGGGPTKGKAEDLAKIEDFSAGDLMDDFFADEAPAPKAAGSAQSSKGKKAAPAPVLDDDDDDHIAPNPNVRMGVEDVSDDDDDAIVEVVGAKKTTPIKKPVAVPAHTRATSSSGTAARPSSAEKTAAVTAVRSDITPPKSKAVTGRDSPTTSGRMSPATVAPSQLRSGTPTQSSRVVSAGAPASTARHNDDDDDDLANFVPGGASDSFFDDEAAPASAVTAVARQAKEKSSAADANRKPVTAVAVVKANSSDGGGDVAAFSSPFAHGADTDPDADVLGGASDLVVDIDDDTPTRRLRDHSDDAEVGDDDDHQADHRTLHHPQHAGSGDRLKNLNRVDSPSHASSGGARPEPSLSLSALNTEGDDDDITLRKMQKRTEKAHAKESKSKDKKRKDHQPHDKAGGSGRRTSAVFDATESGDDGKGGKGFYDDDDDVDDFTATIHTRPSAGPSGRAAVASSPADDDDAFAAFGAPAPAERKTSGTKSGSRSAVTSSTSSGAGARPGSSSRAKDPARTALDSFFGDDGDDADGSDDRSPVQRPAVRSDDDHDDEDFGILQPKKPLVTKDSDDFRLSSDDEAGGHRSSHKYTAAPTSAAGKKTKESAKSPDDALDVKKSASSKKDKDSSRDREKEKKKKHKKDKSDKPKDSKKSSSKRDKDKDTAPAAAAAAGARPSSFF